MDAQFGGVDQRKIFTLAEKVPSLSIFAHFFQPFNLSLDDYLGAFRCEFAVNLFSGLI